MIDGIRLAQSYKCCWNRATEPITWLLKDACSLHFGQRANDFSLAKYAQVIARSPA